MIHHVTDISAERRLPPQMTNPLPYLLRMVVFLIAVLGLAFVLHEDLIRVFLHTPILDGVIVAVLLLGIVVVFRQVIQLGPEVTWLKQIQQRSADAPPLPSTTRLNLLAPMAAMLGERQDQIRLSATAGRALLDGIANRLDERRELARYLIGLLIFLGLLGTFWGLLQTIGSVAAAISNLHVTVGDPLQMFAMLQGSIQGPLQGMATAFGASLFGLSGSLVLGFLELQASQAQGRFHIELEEWLARATSLGGGLSGGEAPANVPAYLEALLERNAEGVDGLVRALQRIETGRQATMAGYGTLVERLASLAETVRTQQTLLARFTELAIDLRGSVGRLSERASASEDQIPRVLEALQVSVSRLIDDTARDRAALAEEIRAAVTKLVERFPEADREALSAHQRSMETQLARLVEEHGRDRVALADDLRGEMRLLARTVANLRSAPAPGVALFQPVPPPPVPSFGAAPTEED
jgi:hypothetical protein